MHSRNTTQGRRRWRTTLLGLATTTAAAVLTLSGGNAMAASSGGISDGSTSGTSGDKAKLVDGLAVAPRSAPRRVKRAIKAANEIVKGKDYCWGGGHDKWNSRCYDCSGTASYALGDPGARLIDAPMPSTGFMSWGRRGKGDWITTYADSGHMFTVIAGLRLDTSMVKGKGPGWSRDVRAGFANVPRTAARHHRRF